MRPRDGSTKEADIWVNARDLVQSRRKGAFFRAMSTFCKEVPEQQHFDSLGRRFGAGINAQPVQLIGT